MTIRKLEAVRAAQMPAMRPIQGSRAELCMLPLDRLVVDERYQRGIGKEGRANVLRIAAGFDWRMFTPVVVTPLPDGTFAIIDGQHRATAALTRGDLQMVPCMVVQVTPEEAAATFAGINGVVTKMSPTQLYVARVAARDPAALVLQRVLDEAGVKVLKYKYPSHEWAVGETLAIGTLQSCLKEHGCDVLKAALLAVTRSLDGNPGLLTAPIVAALCAILKDRPDWMRLGQRLYEAMDEVDLASIDTNARTFAKVDRKPRHRVVRDLIETALKKQIEAAGEGRDDALEAVTA